MTQVKKEEEALVATSFSSTHSMITFAVALLVLLGLFVIIYNYAALTPERVIEIKSNSDLTLAKQRLQTQVEKIQQEVGALRAIVS